jgi:hypothetical protein
MRSYLAKSFYQNYKAKVKKYFISEAELYQTIPKAAYENMDGPKKKDREEVKIEPARMNFEKPSFMACDLLLTYMVYSIRQDQRESCFLQVSFMDPSTRILREFSYFFLSSLLTN